MSEHQSLPGYPPRLRLLIAIALALALPVVVGAVVSIALDPPGLAEALAIALNDAEYVNNSDDYSQDDLLRAAEELGIDLSNCGS